ncbi:LuxR C-terminal-related transcriptional regulator [Streptomyces sp. NPDC007991]|uniref:ATP-binding protein n=1 Tax=Streptomyces sp. NPDC007991 TaxID=3364803 RepID=UPI0036E5B200
MYPISSSTTISDELSAGGPGVLTVAGHGLVGRQEERAELRGLLGEAAVHVVTVTGPAGVGKSRLAAAAFADVVGSFEDGGWAVDLNDVRPGQDPETVLAETLGLDTGTDRPVHTLLREYLQSRRCLLLLDGCDRMRAALVPVVTRLVNDCPRLTVLMTGIERLGVYGEVLLRLGPLELPPADGEPGLAELREIPSVKLFVERTAVSRPNFALTEHNRDAVVRLCRRTDGLPMAIEFAASRMKMLSPQRLLDELDTGLDALSGTEFDTLSRHRAMSAAIARQLEALDKHERALLRRLAVFHRAFDLPTAQAMWPGDVTELQRLLEMFVDKSLLRTDECADGELIISMLGLTRQFLLEEAHTLGESDELATAHATFCADLAESAESGLRGPEQSRWLLLIDYWRQDLIGALDFLARSGDTAGVVRIAASLHEYWQARGEVREGITRLRSGLDAGNGLTLRQQATARLSLAELLMSACEMTAAEECLAEARAAFEELGDHAAVAACVRGAGLVALQRGDLAEADRRLEDCVAATAGGDGAEHAEVLRILAEVRRAEGDAAGARRLAEDALAFFEQQRDVRSIALTRLVLGDVAFALGDQDRALDLYRSALQGIAGLKHLALCALGLEKFTLLLTRCRGQSMETWRRAARALGAAAGIRAATGCVAPGPVRMEVDAVAALTRVRLGDDEAAELAAVGRKSQPDAAVAAVLTPSDGVEPDPDAPDGAVNPLTPREREVAELVANGLTNREIARRLGIAEWTAVNHVRKIMRKLACTSRVQVASWMSKHNSGRRDRPSPARPADARVFGA